MVRASGARSRCWIDTSKLAPRSSRATSPHSTSTFVQRQVGDRVVRRQPIGVGVVEAHPTGLVAVHECERRRRDRLDHTEGLPEPLGEGGLSRTHLTAEHDQIACARHPGDRRSDGAGVGERSGVEPQHTAMLRQARSGRPTLDGPPVRTASMSRSRGTATSLPRMVVPDEAGVHPRPLRHCEAKT